jgi:hypothetical protein
MISVETLIDKQVFMVLRDMKTMAVTGIEQDQNVFVIRGYEPRHGVWVEVPSVSSCPVKSGNKSMENCPAVVFIPWHHVVTMVHFPGQENLEIDKPSQRRVGFRQGAD